MKVFFAEYLEKTNALAQMEIEDSTKLNGVLLSRLVQKTRGTTDIVDSWNSS